MTFPDRAAYLAAVDANHTRCREGLCRACALFEEWAEGPGLELEDRYEQMLDSLGLPSGDLLDAP